MKNFHGYSIESLDPAPYFPDCSPFSLYKQFSEAKSVDQMYRDRDPRYMRFLGDFIDKFRDADLLVMYIYNPIHPVVLCRELNKPIRILGFVDDPFSTYVRGVPYLWAFDGAFYISLGYSNEFLMGEALKRWGCEHAYWWPLIVPRATPTNANDLWPFVPARAEAAIRGDAFFQNRDLDLIYVGLAYSAKMNRLAQFRKRYGSRFGIHGRWPYSGYVGMLRWIRGEPPLWTRVTAIPEEERTRLYYRTKIGLNMHLSDTAMETGNARMYEVPAHGMMLLCDKAALNAHECIFEPDKEAVYYDSVDDAIQKIEYYLKDDDAREKIALAGFERVHRDYDGETNMKKFLDWAISIPRKSCQ